MKKIIFVILQTSLTFSAHALNSKLVCYDQSIGRFIISPLSKNLAKVASTDHLKQIQFNFYNCNVSQEDRNDHVTISCENDLESLTIEFNEKKRSGQVLDLRLLENVSPSKNKFHCKKF
ncbi:MAG: hypothetical protein AB7I27_12380 [Bacteriovoracaceae bacterium]